jgi:hypothetical protein
MFAACIAVVRLLQAFSDDHRKPNNQQSGNQILAQTSEGRSKGRETDLMLLPAVGMGFIT